MSGKVSKRLRRYVWYRNAFGAALDYRSLKREWAKNSWLQRTIDMNIIKSHDPIKG